MKGFHGAPQQRVHPVSFQAGAPFAPRAFACLQKPAWNDVLQPAQRAARGFHPTAHEMRLDRDPDRELRWRHPFHGDVRY